MRETRRDFLCRRKAPTAVTAVPVLFVDSQSKMNCDSSESWEDFASLLFNLLPADSQHKLDRLAQMQLQTQSDEPLLKSQDCRIAVAEIEGLQLRIRHLNEEFDLIEEELKELSSDLRTLNEIDVKELETKLIKISSDINLYQMKVDEYGDVSVPEITSLSELKTLRKEVADLKERVSQWKITGCLYDGIENFQNDHLRHLVRERDEEVRKLTEEIATTAEARRSLI